MVNDLPIYEKGTYKQLTVSYTVNDSNSVADFTYIDDKWEISDASVVIDPFVLAAFIDRTAKELTNGYFDELENVIYYKNPLKATYEKTYSELFVEEELIFDNEYGLVTKYNHQTHHNQLSSETTVIVEFSYKK